MGYVDGLNLYAYVGNNPVNFTDPFGLWFIIDDFVTGPVDELLVLGGLGVAALYCQMAGCEAPTWDDLFPLPLGEDEEDTPLPPAAMDEVDGEDESSVTPTDDEEGICDVDDGPGTDPQKKDPKFPKKGPGGDEILKHIEDELEKIGKTLPVTELPPFTPSTIDEIIASAARAGKGGRVTEGARSISKKLGHAEKLGITSAFDGMKPTQQNAERLIESIMTNPDYAYFGNKTIDVYNAKGQGVRFDKNYNFIGFIEKAMATR